MIALDIGTLRQVVTLSAPEAPVPDGDGNYTQTYVPLEPATWRCAIEGASPRPSETTGAGSILSHATHVFTGRYHAGITSQTRLVWTDRSGTVHTAEALDVEDTEGAGVETVVLATEIEGAVAPPPPPTPTNVLDDFNRANENPLSHAGMWMKPPQIDHPLAVVSNQAASLLVGQAGMSWLAPQGGDFELQVTIAVLPEPGNSSQFGLHCYPDTVSAGFVVAVIPVLNVVLLAQPGGTRTQADLPVVVARGDVLSFARVGTHYICRLRLGGVWYPLLDVDDPSVPGPLYPGIWIQNYVASVLTRLDDFTLVLP